MYFEILWFMTILILAVGAMVNFLAAVGSFPERSGGYFFVYVADTILFLIGLYAVVNFVNI